MNYSKILITIAVMALLTYAVRVIPILIFKKPITNRYVKSFLTYLPYGVLGAMIFPEIFFSTGALVSGIIGCAVAIVLAYFKRGLIIVALGATLAAYITEQIMALVI